VLDEEGQSIGKRLEVAGAIAQADYRAARRVAATGEESARVVGGVVL
jgi:hypothetical protein